VYLLLDVDGRGLDYEIRPVLLILATPDELRVEVAVPTFVRDADGTLLGAIDDRLVFRSECSCARLLRG
jgi:hypothetical protein